MNTVIADSSGIVSLVNATDRNHPRAVSEAQRYGNKAGSILVPSDVLSETLNVLGKKIGRDTAIKTGDTILGSGAFVVIFPDEDTTAQALELFRHQPASVSFTDCMVMAVARTYKVSSIFGFDEVFTKNGLTIPKAV